MMDAFLSSVRRRGVRIYLVSANEIELDDPGEVLTEAEVMAMAKLKPLLIHALMSERARLLVVSSWDADMRHQFQARAEAHVRIEGCDPTTAERLAYEALYPITVSRAYLASAGPKSTEEIIEDIWGPS